MIRQLIIPGIIAGALHGGLLLIPNTPAPLTEAVAVVIDPFPEPPKVREMPIDDPGPPPEDNNVAPPSAPVLPMAPPVVTVDTKGGFTDKFPIDMPRTDIDSRALRVPPGDYMNPGKGSGDGMGGLPSVSIGELDKTPRTVFQVAPDYPYEAKKNSLTGAVTVLFRVDENGDVRDARVVDSTDTVFNDAALRAVSRWRFEPGRLHGKRVAFKMSVPIAFNLGEGE